VLGRGGGLAPHLAARLEAHRDRARALRGAPPEGDDDAVSVVVDCAAATGFVYPDPLGSLTRRKLPYERDDVELLVRLALATDGADPTWRALPRARAATAALERYTRSGGNGDAAALAGELLPWLEDRSVAPGWGAGDWPPVLARVRRLAPSAELDVSMLRGDDRWAEAVRPRVERDHAGCGELLVLLASANAPRPARTWTAGADALLDDAGVALVRMLLETARDVGQRNLGGQDFWHFWVVEPTTTVLRGALWCLPLTPPGDWQTPLAAAMLTRAMRGEDVKIANAALHALGELDGDEPVQLLGGLASRVRDRRFLPAIERALESAAQRRGVSRGELRETLVPTHDLDDDGALETVIGDVRATLAVAAPGAVTLTWADAAGQPLRGAPARVKEQHAAELAALKRRHAELRGEVSAQRVRVEDLLAADRCWTLAAWRAAYLDHPLVGVLARGLAWRVDGVAVLPRSGRLEAVDGTPVAAADGAEVRLWHPIDAPAEEIVSWRGRLRELELVQPFKQAFREIYAVAPAERETGTYSNRFAAHVVAYPQLYALAKGRGWSLKALGPFDNAGAGRQWRVFEQHGVTAELWLDPIEDGGYGDSMLVALASTDQVRFLRHGEQEPMPVADVPPLVFSEAMRDVDLFVGVSSVAADPTWLDHGPDRFHAYWHDQAFGELGETAVSRREALAEILPGLRIADRCTLDERWLVVRGNLRTYRIHLGSANIQMEPDSRYLCIVPSRSVAPKVYLPFPEDERLAVILSKAVMLAADDRIADPTIRAQIGA
jgi:hypothetical protein